MPFVGDRGVSDVAAQEFGFLNLGEKVLDYSCTNLLSVVSSGRRRS
jgi:hypothetical protein